MVDRNVSLIIYQLKGEEGRSKLHTYPTVTTNKPNLASTKHIFQATAVKKQTT